MSSATQIIRRRRARQRRQHDAARRNLHWGLLLGVVLGGGLILPFTAIALVALFLYTSAAAAMPTQAQTIYIDPIQGTTELVDRDGREVLLSVVDPLGDERSWVTLDSLPPQFLSATLQMEAPRYLDETRFRPQLVLDQLWRYVVGQPIARETSITRRLARGTLIPLAISSGLDSLLLEIVFSAELERRFTPQQILEWYLNTAYYGNDAYGIEAAAQVYLGKSARDLTLDEAALLAAIPPAPQFNPFDNQVAARGRQADLLSTLLVQGRILTDDYQQAAARQTPLRSDALRMARIAPEFSTYAREQAEDLLNGIGLDGARLVSRGGLRILTTLDLDLYYQSECTLRAHLAQLNGAALVDPRTLNGVPCTAASFLGDLFNVDRSSPPDNGTLLLLDVRSGEMLAMVGDAISIQVAPGPTLHPFVYLQGFLSGEFTPASMLLDVPQNFPGPADGLIYTPTNPDGIFRGPINLRDAMASGLLAPAVYIAENQGLNRVLFAAHRMGLNTLEENLYDLSLLERGGQVSVLDLTYAYSVFAGLGWQQGVDAEPIAAGYRARNPVAVLRIEAADGSVLWEYDATRRALSRTNIFLPELGFLINDILADASRRQTVLGVDAAQLSIGRRAALVHGVTGDRRDAWTLGYTPERVLGVHLGRADQATISADAHGVQVALPVWRAVLRYAHDRDALPLTDWPRPVQIEEYTVCERSGLLPRSGVTCPTRREYFLAQVPPTQEDTYWQVFEVNSQTRQLATAFTPTNLRIQNVYFVPPTTALDWWRSNGLPLPPTEYDVLSRPEVLRAVQIFLPEDFQYVGNQVDVRGSIDTQNLQTFQLLYGQGLNPTQWLSITGQQTEFVSGTSLGLWDTSGLDGIYTLQLAVAYRDGSRDADFVQVTVDNVAPEVSLQAGEPGQVFRFPQDTVIPVVAAASDNLAIQRVEFYHNGLLVQIDEQWPYGFEFTVQRPGIETFRAVVFDQVGNQAEAETQIEILRGS